MIWSPDIQTLSGNVHQIHLGGASVILIQTFGGPMKPFLSGTGLMAVEGNLPVIPMSIHVDKLGYPVYIPFSRRGNVIGTFGEPMLPPWDGTPDEITTLLEKSVANLGLGS